MQGKFSSRLMYSSALALAISVGSAYAQDADEAVEVTTISEDAGEEESVQERVVVTGSRIARNEFTSPVAIDVLTADEAKIEGLGDVAALLQTSTAASGSSQINAAVANEFVSNGGTGAETLALRGLGANRTLFLLNGRRAGPSGTRGSVSSFDLNSIPLAAVERVEILKDGASAVYGSDAIAGVVNIITRKEDGGVIDGYTSLPSEGGGEEFRLSGSYGKTFERGSIRVTGDYFKREILARGDRDYLDCNEAYAFNDDGSRADVIDPRTGQFQCRDLLWGHVWIYDYAGDTNVPTTFPFLAQYDYDGSLAANIPGYPNSGAPGQLSVPNGFFPIYYDQNDIDGLAAWNGITVGTEPRGLVDFDHPFQNAETLVPQVERITLMAEGEFQLSDNITAYGEALYNQRETYSDGYRQFWSYHYGGDSQGLFGGPGTNPEASAQGWEGLQWFSPTAISDRADEEVTVEYTRFVGGLRGDLGGFAEGFNWDLAYQYSKSDGEYVEDFIYQDAIFDYNFQTTLCGEVNGGLTSVAGRPCVDVPWFDPALLAGEYSPEVENFLFTRDRGNTEYTQSSIEGYLSGPIFTLPAGEVGAAVGFLYQEDEITDTPSNIILAGNAWGASSAGITTGKQEQTAVFGEIEIPIFKDQPFAESLTIAASGRLTDINTVDDTGETYRVGLNWAINDQFRFRATQGTSFRAPGLFELFLADETSFARQGVIDPCFQWGSAADISPTVAANCAAEGIPQDHAPAISADVFRGGGLGQLEPETSDNFSAGVVWTPGFIDLSVAVDYFDIEINDEITTLTAQQIVQGCYTADSFPNEPLCDRFDRNPAGPDGFRITDVRAQFVNVASQVNEGFDVTARYVHGTPWGDLVVDAQATHQLESFTQLDALGEIEDLNGEYGEPETTGYVNFTLDTDTNWDFFWGIDYIGETDQQERSENDSGTTLYGVPVNYKYYTEEVIYHTLSTEYTRDDWTFRIGVSNVFDEHPPAVSDADAGNSLVVSQYDYLGRRVFLNLSKSF
ncbi:MAG: TonB-dependent receptor plug domain-containing protein [Henriciella sp.]